MKYLEEKRNDLITRAEAVLNGAKTEKRELTEAEETELADIKEEIRKIDATMGFDSEFRAMQEKEKKEDAPAKDAADVETRAKEEKEHEAFENYIRGYVVHERAGELTPAATSGGATIPTSIANKIIKKVYDISPILQRSSQYNVKGNLDLPFYTTDNSNPGIAVAYQNEFAALASSNGKFDKIQLTGFLAGALSKISRSLINNSQFDIVTFVVNEMSDAIARFIEKEQLIGTNGKVTGLSTLTNLVNAAAASAITADEVIKLHDAIKDRYQQNAIWIMSNETRTALRLLQDGQHRYLLQDDISSPFGVSILGKPVFVSDNMPAIATGNVPIYYGDMKGLATKFSENINIEVLRERYADEHAVGVIGWFEFDSKVENEQMIAGLKMA